MTMKTDVVIVGAGPIGLELAVCLKQMGVAYEQIEAGQIGQTISWYPRQVQFFSSPERIAIAGMPLHTTAQNKASREEYLAYLRAVVQHYELHIRTFERVEHIDSIDDGFVVHSKRGVEKKTTFASHVVLAIGDMHHPRLMHIPGEDLPHVTHYFEDPHRYFNQRLLIIGGKNSAVEAALRCYRIGAKVTISYRKPDFDKDTIKYWLLPEIKSLIDAGHITFHPCTTPVQIVREHVKLTPSREETCQDSPTRPERSFNVPADFVLALTGYMMDTSLLQDAGVELAGAEHAPSLDEDTMQTNIPGLYVAGTAIAGTQMETKVFIETSHPHVRKIVHAITGENPPTGLINEPEQAKVLPEA